MTHHFFLNVVSSDTLLEIILFIHHMPLVILFCCHTPCWVILLPHALSGRVEQTGFVGSEVSGI